MHILLTDILTCPRCGPEFGLILLAESMAGRRVLEGALGCANCREKYAVHEGRVLFGAAPAASPASAAREAHDASDAHDAQDAPDGRSGPDAQDAAGVADTGTARSEDFEAAVRLAALMGVTQGPAYAVIAGPAADRASTIAGLLEDVEVVVVAEPGSAPAAGEAAVNTLEITAPLPLANARIAGIVLSGDAADTLLEEGARVLAPLGRLVLEPAPEDAAARLGASGLHILAQEHATIVAVNRHAAPRRGPGAAYG